MIGIGGSIRATKNMNNDMFELSRENNIIFAENISELLKELKNSEKETLKRVLRTSPDRVHTLLRGMMIMDTVCQYVKCRNIVVSPYGVREGYLYQKLFPMDNIK